MVTCCALNIVEKYTQNIINGNITLPDIESIFQLFVTLGTSLWYNAKNTYTFNILTSKKVVLIFCRMIVKMSVSFCRSGSAFINKQ